MNNQNFDKLIQSLSKKHKHTATGLTKCEVIFCDASGIEIDASPAREFCLHYDKPLAHIGEAGRVCFNVKSFSVKVTYFFKSVSPEEISQDALVERLRTVAFSGTSTHSFRLPQPFLSKRNSSNDPRV